MSATGKPLKLEDFNVHIFCGLRSNLQDIVPTILSHSEPITFTYLQGFLIKAFPKLHISEPSSHANFATANSAKRNFSTSASTTLGSSFFGS